MDRRIATLTAALVGVGVGLGARPWVLSWIHRRLVTSSLPDALALFVGAAAAACVMAVFARRARSEHTAWWAWAAASPALAAAIVAAMVHWDPKVCRSSHLPDWVGAFCAVAALIWAGGWAIERLTARRWHGITAVLCGLALAALTLSTGDRLADNLRGERVRVWNIYHYYLGSKYFGELGYDQLYAATLAADTLVAPALADDKPTLSFVHHTRDMETYRLVPRRQAIANLDPRIDRRLLIDLHSDLRPLLPLADEKTWRLIVSDLGYNPAPAWPVIGKPLARAIPTDSPAFLWLINLDIPLFVAILIACLWAWGPRATAVMVLYISLVGFNKVRLTGGLLQYDWLASLLIGVALWRRGWTATGGAVLSWGAMTRVFPGFFVFPALAALAWRVVRRRPLGLSHPPMRFLVAFTVACSVWFALSHTTGRGMNTWPEWVQAIRHHSKLHGIDGRARLGLTRLGAHQPTDDNPWNAIKRTVDPVAAEALQAKVLPWKIVGALVVVLVVVRRRDPLERAIWMLALVWVGVVTSRYYGSSWALLATLGLPRDDDAGPRQAATGVWAGTMLLLMPGVFYAGGDDNDAIYLPVNYWMGLTLLGIAGLWARDDVAAWLQRRADPQPSEPATSPAASSSE